MDMDTGWTSVPDSKKSKYHRNSDVTHIVNKIKPNVTEEIIYKMKKAKHNANHPEFENNDVNDLRMETAESIAEDQNTINDETLPRGQVNSELVPNSACDVTNNLQPQSFGNVSFYDANDIEPFLIYVESKDTSKNVGNLHPLSLGKKMFSGNVQGIIELTQPNKNRVVCNFKSFDSANMFINSNFVKTNNLNAYIPSFQLARLGIIRHVDTSLTEEDIYENLQLSNDIQVLSVKRLTRSVLDENGEKTVKALPLVTIKFKGKQLPEFVYLFYTRCPVEPYVSNPVLCYNCIRYGHSSRNCKGRVRCPNCSESHNASDCPKSKDPSCIFCNGSHGSLDRSCPEYEKQKQIKTTMAYRNIPYWEAKKLLFPDSFKTDKSFSSIAESNYEGKFPCLPNQNSNVPCKRVAFPLPLHQKLPVPASRNTSFQRFQKTSVHQKQTHKPVYTHSYYRNLESTEVIPSQAVYMSTSSNKTDQSLTKRTHSNNTVSPLPSDTLLHIVNKYKKGEVNAEEALESIQCHIQKSNEDLQEVFSDTSF